jgi:hypothetical protein
VRFRPRTTGDAHLPFLLPRGDHDPNGGASVARRFASQLPNAELTIVSDAEPEPSLDALEF